MANGKALLKEKDKPRKLKKKSTSKLKKELDTLFSQFIRQKYANKEGEVSCFTCGKRDHWKRQQCGHFVSRAHLATRFDEGNCRPQCVGCNLFGGGQIAAFARGLEHEIGEQGVMDLFRKANEIVKDFPYQTKIDYYKSKLNS